MGSLNKLKFLALTTVMAAVPALAGNIFLTGHDDDFHFSAGDPAAAQLLAAITFARGGSALPVLTFDAGSELTSDLTSLGIAFTNVNPNTAAAVTDSLFDNSTFSAFVVASDTTCGGCDNSAGGEANIASHTTAIANFLNAGGGVVGLAGANSVGYYDFVPQTATSVGGAPSTGYSQTSVGASLSIPDVNGDFTHNLFSNPGVNGESSFYQIVELNLTTGNGVILPPAAVSLACVACTTSGGVITGGGSTPEPATWATMGSAILAAGIVSVRRRRARKIV